MVLVSHVWVGSSILQAQRNSTGENCRWTPDWPCATESSGRMCKPGAVPGSARRRRVSSAGATERLFSHRGPLSHSYHFPSGDLEKKHQCILNAFFLTIKHYEDKV